MKRIEILYGGESYTIADRSYDEVRDEILAAVADGRGWLRVNHGAGLLAPADLLITPGVSLALVRPAPEDEARED